MRHVRPVVAGAAVVVLLGALARVFVAPPADTPGEGGPVDAIVVLGGGIRDERLRTAEAAVAAQTAGDAAPPALVLSVPYGPDYVTCPATTVVAGRTVPLACVVPDPFTTTGEASAVARLASTRGWRRVAIVTSSYHLARAGVVFDRCLDEPVVRYAAGVGTGELRLWWNVALEIPSLGAALTFDRPAC